MEKRLYRSRADRMLFGVCGGLAKYFGIDPSIMRIIVILLALSTGIGVLIYFVMAFIIPLEGSEKTAPKEVFMENVQDVKTTAQEFGKKAEDAFAKKAGSEEEALVQARRRNALGIIIIVIGVIILLSTIGIFNWGFWWVLWPVVLIAIGVAIIIGVSRK
jgi:phage shock protein PspC (stress-responsive transcriptional regulator)